MSYTRIPHDSVSFFFFTNQTFTCYFTHRNTYRVNISKNRLHYNQVVRPRQYFAAHTYHRLSRTYPRAKRPRRIRRLSSKLTLYRIERSIIFYCSPHRNLYQMIQRRFLCGRIYILPHNMHVNVIYVNVNTLQA